MGASYRASTTATSASGTVAATIPASAVAGDLLIAFLADDNAGSDFATPAGWTKAVAYSYCAAFYKYAAGGDAGAAVSFANSSGHPSVAIVAAYSSVLQVGPIDATGTASATASSIATASVTTTRGSDLVVEFAAAVDPFDASAPVTGVPATQRATASTSYVGAALADQVQGTAGATPAQTFTSAGAYMGALTIAIAGNSAPNAPALNSPATNATFDRSVPQRFAWTFSDPDVGDSQSAFDLRYRIVGASSWTTVSGTTPNAYYDFAGAALAAGSYEWQVRTYDSIGAQGVWSASSFFTAADATNAPTISAPVNGSTVSNVATVTWSAPNQTDYQVRRVADNAGAADTSTVYSDTGDVVDGTTRSITLTFDTNNRYEHVQVRIKNGGLWSTWADARVQVSYSAPAKPLVNVYPNGAGIDIGWSSPAPTGGQPTVAYVDVLIDDDDGLGEQRKATSQPSNGAWHYSTPRSGIDYDPLIRVRAVATNGVVSYSDPPADAPVYFVEDGGTPSATGTASDGGGV